MKKNEENIEEVSVCILESNINNIRSRIKTSYHWKRMVSLLTCFKESFDKVFVKLPFSASDIAVSS